MGQTQINPRLLMVAAAAALVVALLTLTTHSLVVSAMSWLAFEILAILSVIFLTTPGSVASPTPENAVAPTAVRNIIAKIYDSPADTVTPSVVETIIPDNVEEHL